MRQAEVIVWATPIYWHGMTGALKTLIERMNDEPAEQIAGRHLALVYQGSAPGRAVDEVMHTTAQRLAEVFHLDLVGVAGSERDLAALRRRLLRLSSPA